MDDPSMNDSRG